jgi:hypothetical protein
MRYKLGITGVSNELPHYKVLGTFFNSDRTLLIVPILTVVMQATTISDKKYP